MIVCFCREKERERDVLKSTRGQIWPMREEMIIKLTKIKALIFIELHYYYYCKLNTCGGMIFEIVHKHEMHTYPIYTRVVANGFVCKVSWRAEI